MKRYASFNAEGRSTVTTNIIPEGEEDQYFPVPDDVHGTVLIKEGEVIRDLSEKETEELRVQALVDFYSKEIRAKRNRLLNEADVLTQQDRWESYSDAKKKKISTYKQALRDITKQKGFPKTVNFPAMPE